MDTRTHLVVENADFTISPAMSLNQVTDRVSRARTYFGSRNDLSEAKLKVINAMIQYAEQRLCARSLFSKAENRYVIYSEIIRSCHFLDDLHFLHYAAKQLRCIDVYDNSTMRAILPDVMRDCDYLMAPEVLRAQKAFLGMVAFGFATMFVCHSPIVSTTCITLGLIGYLGSYHIVQERLERSLAMNMNRRLTGGVSQPLQLEDGLSDEIGRFQHAATNMLTHGVRFFEGASTQFGRVASIPGGSPMLALQAARVGAASDPRIEELDGQGEQNRQLR